MKLKQFEDFQLYVREKDWGFWQNSEYEPEETRIIKSLVKPHMFCLDIGANIGYYSVLMDKLGANVFAFEPEPSNFELLTHNSKINDCNVTCFNAVITNNHESNTLYLCDTNNGMHRMFKSKYCGKPIKVGTAKLPSDFPCDFIKIDVEGSELDVINGMYQIIKKYKPIMLIEFHPPTLEEKGDNPEKLYYHIKALGYDIHLVPNIEQTISYEDLYKETMKEPSGRNILCLKK